QEPPPYDRYFRVRYYVGSPSRPTWTARELVYPAHREDQVRVLTSFRDSYEDKAFEIAYNEFYTHRDAKTIRDDTRSSELPPDLAPIARYFARRFQDTHLLPDERLVRVEVWHGTAPTPARR